MIKCNTVGELRDALTALPGELPFAVYYEGRCCHNDYIVIHGIHAGVVIFEADDDAPFPMKAGLPMWRGIERIEKLEEGK